MNKCFRQWGWEIFWAIIGLIYIAFWIAVPEMKLTDVNLRNSINTLLQSAFNSVITSTSILFPATIAIYFILTQRGYSADVVKRFYRAIYCFLFGIGAGIWNIIYIPVVAHREINLALDDSIVATAIIQYSLFFVGIFEMFLGGCAYRKERRRP